MEIRHTINIPYTNRALKWIVSTVQAFSYIPLLMIRLFTVKHRLRRERPILGQNNDAPYLIYANHQSVIDPFMICASMPLLTILKLLPFRFFAKPDLFENTFTKIFITAFGGFPAQAKTQKGYGIKIAEKLLQEKQTVLIFPQGKRTSKRTAKRGISVLANKTKVRLIPVNIHWTSTFNCNISIGRSFDSSGNMEPSEMMDIVYGL